LALNNITSVVPTRRDQIPIYHKNDGYF